MIAAEAKPAVKDIEDQLGRILRSKVFASSQRSQKFLQYVVHKSLSDGAPPKEFVIAVDVFERDSSYDPAVDATVRVQAGRLRSRLREYYDGDGKDDPIVISIPTGSYVPVYTVREQTSDSSSKLPTPTRKISPLETNTAPQFWSIFSFSAQVLVPIATLCLIVLTATIVMHRKAQSDSPIHSLAVLPLVNLSQDPTMEYFADGMTEELTTDLSYVKALRVVSRASTIGFKKSNLSVQQIAGQLQVDAVIEGTVLRANNTVRVTVRLTTAKPERQIWAASYERNLSDAITLQDQIAAEAVTQIRVQLTPEERTRLSLENRISPEAYDEYLRARFLLAQETKQRNKAIPHLERAIKLDPNFAAAYAALGEAWGMEGVWGGRSNRETSAMALAYSEKAVSLDPTSSETYASLGLSLMQSRRWNDGEVALRRALELNPNNSSAAEYLALLLEQKGRLEESVKITREVASANPVAVDFQRLYASSLYRARRYDEAIEQCQRILELDPTHLVTYATLATALVEKGRYQEAGEALARGNWTSPGVRAWLYAREGNQAAARQIVLQNPSLLDAHFAVARYLLGEQEAALAELDYLANEMWSTRTYNLRNDPAFDPMRGDPRFNAIVKKTGLLDN